MQLVMLPFLLYGIFVRNHGGMCIAIVNGVVFFAGRGLDQCKRSRGHSNKLAKCLAAYADLLLHCTRRKCRPCHKRHCSGLAVRECRSVA